MTDVARLADDRRTGRLDEGGCADALARAGFDDARAAADALDHLLAAPGDDLDVGAFLEGCASSADPGRALYNGSRLLGLADRPRCPAPMASLARFLGASQHMADLLVGRPDLLASLGRPFDPVDAEGRYRRAGEADDGEGALRRAQQEDLLAIAWQDLVGGLDVEQVTILLSRLADAVVAGAAHATGAADHFAVIGLGKLGGLELNYSSDIDLVFVRPDAAQDQMSADASARSLLRLLGRQTVDGHLYRVDMRLRPEGTGGALTRTVSSCLSYYRERGRPWERQMLTKGRVLADCGEAGEEFLRGVRRWILDCGLDAAAVRQFKRLKRATEAHHGGLDDRTDVKQSPGGIRDIETIVQFLALQHAAHNPYLICNATLHGLERLRLAGALSSLEAARLRRAYLFHRRVENLLQVMHRVQTHRLPADLRPLARLMGARDPGSFEDELEEHRRRVRTIFARHFEQAFPATEGPAAVVSQLLLDPEPDPDAFRDALSALGFGDSESSRQVLRRAAAPLSRFLPVSPRQVSALASLAPVLLEHLALAPDPGAALDRFERMTRGVGAREILYARLLQDARLRETLCDLAGGSPHLADLLAAEPQLFDAFLDALATGHRGRRRRRERLVLPSHGMDPWLLLSDYKKLETLRIGALDLQDAAPTVEVLHELSHLCIDVLRNAFEVVWEAAVAEHGRPFTIKGVSARVPAGMIVVALGKVGGLEANYGSDADVLFVSGGDGETSRGVPNRVFFSRVAEEFIARVSGSRGTPRLYKVDARLRPEGTKGPLVTTLRALEQYYRSPRAALFEHMALLKARVVAGDMALGQRCQATVRNVLRRVQLPDDIRSRLRAMRERIEARASGRDLKRGTGGMVDIEQLTQALQLWHGAREPAVLVPETPRALQMLADHGVLRSFEARWLRDTYLFFRRVEMRLQIALGLDTKEVPEDGPALRHLALRLGYADTAEGDAGHLLLVDLEEATAGTRARYERLMGGPSG